MATDNVGMSGQGMNGQGTVGGGWLGTYAYRGGQKAQPPVRFEATFTDPDAEGRFGGVILDDNGMGEASVTGAQGGQGVRFSKMYGDRTLAPVSYEGTLSDDSRTMQGTWRIADDAHGVWDAHRLWAESEGGEEFAEEAMSEPSHPREVVRLG